VDSIHLGSFQKSAEGLSVAVLIESNASLIVRAHDIGPLVYSMNGLLLSIKMPKKGESARDGRITLDEWERRTGVRPWFIYHRRGPS
jgi:hypothetical protein